MRFQAVTNDKKIVQAPKAKNFQQINKHDFESVWGISVDYKTDRHKRQEIMEL